MPLAIGQRPVLTGTLVLALAAATAGARAGPPPDRHCTREDARAAGRLGRSAATPLADAVALEAARPLPAALDPGTLLRAPAGGLAPAPFADHLDFATRLRAVRRLKLLPVYDDAWVTVFLGLDRRGVPGLHVQAQEGDDLGALLWSESAPRSRAALP